MNNKKEVLKILKENNNDVVSGGFIANRLGISRNAVWKIIRSLREDGFNIVSLKNKGYKLELDTTNILDIAEINKFADSKTIGSEIELIANTDSTNNFIKKMSTEQMSEGYTVIANSQTAGKGRYGRQFFSPENSGVYLSILLKSKFKEINPGIITVIAGISVCKTVEEITGLKPGIKWVNDVLIDDKKICGILTEGSVSMETGLLESAVVGIGVNVNLPDEEDIPTGLRDILGYLSEFTGSNISRNEVAGRLLSNFEHYYFSSDLNYIYDEYKKRLLYLGDEITVHALNKTLTGTLIDINKDFSAQVRLSSGELQNYNSGEISIRRTYNDK